MGTGSEIQVRMCELAVGSGSDVLRATLGSCVGIGLLWREQARYGLAHCLLPDGPSVSAGLGAKYVTRAIPLLLARMQAQHHDLPKLEAVLAGGGNMVHLTPAPRHGPIGEQNIQMAQQMLAQLGVRVVHTDVGGECGRQLLIDCARHEYLVKIIARP